MACRGGLLALTPEQLGKLQALPSTDAKAEYLDDLFDDDYWQDLDKAWDGLHRCLSNYPSGVEGLPDEITREYGAYPLKIAILGGKDLNTDDNDGWIINLIEAEQIGDLVKAMDAIDETAFSERYGVSCKDAYPEYGDEDRGYTWAYFQEARDFLRRFAGTGRSVVFMADQ